MRRAGSRWSPVEARELVVEAAGLGGREGRRPGVGVVVGRGGVGGTAAAPARNDEGERGERPEDHDDRHEPRGQLETAAVGLGDDLLAVLGDEAILDLLLGLAL